MPTPRTPRTASRRSDGASAAATPGATTDATRARANGGPPPPILVRQVRGGVTESVHRGDIVETDIGGKLLRLLGDPDRVVTLRSTAKPFGLAALVADGGIEAFDLAPDELALLASSHSGEDLHVRTLVALFRRTGLAQAALMCGTEGMPLDALTSARLARDGERIGPFRHMCSGQHAGLLLLARLHDWPLEEYWLAGHPVQVRFRTALAAAFGVAPGDLVRATDGCGIPTYAFPLRDVARAFAFLADPDGLSGRDRRSAVAPALRRIRDAMLAHPEMVAGTRDRLDTSLMKALPGRIVSKAGMEGLRGIGVTPGPRGANEAAAATGMAVKIEDGAGFDRGTWAASVEALAQAGVLEGQALRVLGRYHRPVSLDPHGREAAEAVAGFDLVPVGEWIG